MADNQDKARMQTEANEEAEDFMREVRLGERQKLAAFERIARKYRKPLSRHIQFGLGWAMEKTGNTADDYVTDTFVKLWKAILAFDNRNKRGLFPYLKMIAKNAILSDLGSPMLEIMADGTALLQEESAQGHRFVKSRDEDGKVDVKQVIERVHDPSDGIGHLEVGDCIERVIQVLELQSGTLATIVRMLCIEVEHADIARAVGVDQDNFRKYYLFRARQKVTQLTEELC